MYIKVKNLNGTADNNPPYGYSSWKDYWIMVKGYWPSCCAVYGCTSIPTVAAHVKIVDSLDNDWYLVPMCYYHNNQRGEMLLVDDRYLVKANIRNR